MKIYCLTYKSPSKKTKMQERLNELGLDCEFVESVSAEDINISSDVVRRAKDLKLWYPKPFSCFSGFLKIFEKILNGTDDMAIILENDVQLRKDIKKLLPDVIENFKRISPDIMCLVYQNYNYDKPLDSFGYFISQPQIKPDFKTHADQKEYYDSRIFKHESLKLEYTKIWGTQMYIITKKFAEFLLNNYGLSYAESSICDTSKNVWNPDYIINKVGKTVIINPMLGVECFIDLNDALETQTYEGFDSQKHKIKYVLNHVKNHNRNRHMNYVKDLHI